MPDLNDYFKTDNVDDVMAVIVNNLIAGNLRGELTNTQTLSGTLTLNDASFPIQNLTPSGATRTVLLPPEAATNHVFFFRNVSGTQNLVIKDDSNTTTFATILPGGSMAISPIAGTTWMPFSLWYALPAIVDSTTPAASPASVDAYHNMLGAMLRSITGAAAWYTKAPSLTDSTTPTSSPADVATLHGMLGNALRGITGAANWYTKTPTITDSTAPTSSPADVATFHSMVANILKTITGKSNWYDAAVAPQSIAIGANANAAVVATGVTTYLGPFGPGAFNATIGQTYWPVTKPGTVRNFRVRTNSAQSAGGTFVITVMKAAAAQTLEISIAAGEAGGTKADTTNSFTVVAGDLITFRFVNNGSGNSAQVVGVSCELSHQ